MQRQKRSGGAARSSLTYVLIVAVGIVGIALLAGLAYGGYWLLVQETPTPAVAVRATKPWPTVVTATPTVTRLPSATPMPAPTFTSTPRPTNTPAPTPTPTPTPILLDRQELGKMVTIQYKLQTISVVEEKDASWIVRLFGDNRVVLVATGEVLAGVDMTLLTDEDITTDGTTVKIIMPPAQVVSVHLVPGESWVYDRKLNILKPNWQLELQAQEQAELSLRGWSIENGILQQAEEVFTIRIEAFLRRLGFSEVTILFRGSD